MRGIYKFRKVSDLLACAGQPTEEQLKELAGGQYQIIINLAPYGTRFSLPDEHASVNALGMEYYHIPVIFDSPVIAELTGFIKLMELHSDKKMLVHCVINYRASAFTGLYLYKAGLLDEEETQLFIEDSWLPDAIWQQFIDDGLEYLKKNQW